MCLRVNTVKQSYLAFMSFVMYLFDGGYFVNSFPSDLLRNAYCITLYSRMLGVLPCNTPHIWAFVMSLAVIFHSSTTLLERLLSSTSIPTSTSFIFGLFDLFDQPLFSYSSQPLSTYSHQAQQENHLSRFMLPHFSDWSGDL